MSKSLDYNLTKKQKEAIAEQLADFFFDFWNNKQIKNKSLKKKEQNHCLGSGFSEEFSQNPG